MVKYWPKESMPRLLLNLDSGDMVLRRKSVLALGLHGISILDTLVDIAQTNKSTEFLVSCMKIFVQVAAIETDREFPDNAISLIEYSLWNESPQLILTVIPLLKLLGKQGIPLLLESCKDTNILRASAAITALGEIKGNFAKKALEDIFKDCNVDPLILSRVNDVLNRPQIRSGC